MLLRRRLLKVKITSGYDRVRVGTESPTAEDQTDGEGEMVE